MPCQGYPSTLQKDIELKLMLLSCLQYAIVLVAKMGPVTENFKMQAPVMVTQTAPPQYLQGITSPVANPSPAAVAINEPFDHDGWAAPKYEAPTAPPLAAPKYEAPTAPPLPLQSLYNQL